MAIYLCIFSGLALFSLLNNHNKKIYFFFVTTLFILAAFRGVDVDRDYKTYISIYEYIIDGEPYTIEPTFYLMSWVSYLLTNSYELIFIVFCFAALFYKVKYIKQFSPYIFLSLLVYYSNFYFLHEMTQIRIGVGVAIGFFALKFLVEGNKRKFIYYIIAACCFHFSMVVMLIALKFNSKKISSKYIYIILCSIGLCYFSILWKINPVELLGYLPVPVIQEKLRIYNYQTQQGMIQPVNVFSIMQLFRIFILIFVFASYKKFSGDERFVLFLKIYALSPICLVLFSAIPAFAIRMSEIFAVAEIVLLPMIVYRCQQKNIAKLLVILYSACILSLNLYHNQIISGYHF